MNQYGLLVLVKLVKLSDANKICSLIRKLIGFNDVIIQYGGSVKPSNIDEIMSMSDIDGVLVGGSSLDPQVLQELQIINNRYPWPDNWGQKTSIMGIINLTPDSFSDGGD